MFMRVPPYVVMAVGIIKHKRTEGKKGDLNSGEAA
jgi:hypothetical protein